MYDLNTQLNNKFLLIRRLIIKSARKFRHKYFNDDVRRYGFGMVGELFKLD